MQFDSSAITGGRRLQGIVTARTADQPLVTIITSIYNGQPYVAGCLDSVLSQDYPNIEHIIMDGGSTDGTLDVLRQYNDKIAFWKSEPDHGIYDAWNKGISEARGEWICFLGVDDIFLPGAISDYMALAAKKPEAEYLYSKWHLVFPTGKELILGREFTSKEFLRAPQTYSHVGSMHKRSLFERLGGYDTKYRIAADWEFLVRLRGKLKMAFLPQVAVRVRSGGASYSPAVIYEIYRAKHTTAGVPRILALYDFSKLFFRIKLRDLVHRILGKKR
jgi:glycosyltransferase involved in cell wall biosynthesis